MNIGQKLVEILGSGFSRRYLEIKDWQDLLSRFCVPGKTFEHYHRMQILITQEQRFLFLKILMTTGAQLKKYKPTVCFKKTTDDNRSTNHKQYSEKT